MSKQHAFSKLASPLALQADAIPSLPPSTDTDSPSTRPASERDKAADGLRGISAIAVFFSHFSIAFYPLGLSNYYPWIAPNGVRPGLVEQALALPFFSVLWNGHFQVCVFFVLSGYVLTKPYFDTGDASIIQKRAARRFLRLSVPVFASVVFAYALMKFGAYQALATAAISPSPWLTALNGISDPTFKSALYQGMIGTLIYGEATYIPALWTMRIELVGSMLIFGYCLLVPLGKRAVSLTGLYVILTITFASTSCPFYLGFLCGMLIGRLRPQTNKFVVWTCVVLGMACGSATYSLGVLDTYSWFRENRFSLLSTIGAALVFYAVRSGAFIMLFKWAPVQFLGRISYPLYLLHMPILFSLSCGVYNWLLIEHSFLRWGATAIALAVTLPVLLGAAWLFEVCIDTPAVNLSRRLVQ